jgi:predicted Fe-Mo cluster-binding NifX family protein
VTLIPPSRVLHPASSSPRNLSLPPESPGERCRLAVTPARLPLSQRISSHPLRRQVRMAATVAYEEQPPLLTRSDHDARREARGIRIAEWLVAHKADVVLAQEDLKNKGLGYALANSSVEVRQVKARTLTEALKAR